MGKISLERIGEWQFTPLEEVVAIYERMGLIQVTLWALPVVKFLRDIKRLEAAVRRLENEKPKGQRTREAIKRSIERNNEYLARCYVIQDLLGV